jgi:CRISPR/Cas system-associated exonuclease Cas4 (RecB family)
MPTLLSTRFRFTQNNLNDFLACNHRFYQRHLAQQPWPATDVTNEQALAHERRLRAGVVLHRWIERYWLGAIDPMVDAPEGDGELCALWSRFLSTDFSFLPAQRNPELALSCELGTRRLYARFDLLAIEPGRAVIVDWKAARNVAYEDWASRLQTRVYLFVLAEAGTPYHEGVDLKPAQCEMRYWLGNAAQPWVIVPYSNEQHEANRAYLTQFANDIYSRSHIDQFPLTDDHQQCALCGYRTLCKREGRALREGWLDELRDEDREIMDDRDVHALEY